MAFVESIVWQLGSPTPNPEVCLVITVFQLFTVGLLSIKVTVNSFHRVVQTVRSLFGSRPLIVLFPGSWVPQDAKDGPKGFRSERPSY